MIVTLGFYKRRPDLSWEQYSEHWRTIHGPLLRETPGTNRYIRRYVQHHLRPNTAFGADPLPYDGFSETWYDSIEDRLEMFASGIWAEVFIPDEEKFLDRSRTAVSMIDHQLTVIGGPTIIGGESITFF
jgi:uncharacterized protein (TIGR02118 family)